MGKEKAPTTPSYAPKLQDWYDKELQQANIENAQKGLCDQIAQEMGLTMGERRNVTHRGIAYVVVGNSYFDEQGQEITTCSINAGPVHEEIV